MSHGTPSQSSGVRIFPPGVYLGGLIVGYAVEWLWPLPIAPGRLAVAVRTVGLVVLIVGLVLVAAAAMRFRRAGTPLNPTEPTVALVLDGPYQFTRNPIYLGFALVLGGLALLGNALWPLIAIVPVTWVIQTQVIAREEAYLATKFGNDYRAFRSRVRRWL
jgi:protein-S-isoprenylcysteine O-methyltransferase Ste14